MNHITFSRLLPVLNIRGRYCLVAISLYFALRCIYGKVIFYLVCIHRLCPMSHNSNPCENLDCSHHPTQLRMLPSRNTCPHDQKQRQVLSSHGLTSLPLEFHLDEIQQYIVLCRKPLSHSIMLWGLMHKVVLSSLVMLCNIHCKFQYFPAFEPVIKAL